MYLLDTNVIPAVRSPERGPLVAAWLRGKPEQDLFLGVITLGEIERGIRRQDAQDPAFARDLRARLDRTVLLFSDRLLPFEAEDARIWGRLSADIGHAGADLMITAQALRHGATVVTGNSGDFAPTGAPSRITSPRAAVAARGLPRRNVRSTAGHPA
jgi:toxin FitB